jgi:hypothetical protein
MRSALAISLAIILASIAARLHLASSDPGLNIPVTTGQGVTATITLSIEDSLGQFTVQQSGQTAIYTDGTYEVQVTETPSKARSIIHVVARKLSGDAFRVDSFSATARIPKGSISGIWYPGADPSSTSAMVTDATQPINDISDANYGIPYIAAAAANSRNVFAMGLGRQDFAVSITGQPMDPGFYEFRLKALTPRTSSTFDERFYVSTDSAMNWFNTAGNYADWVDGLNKYVPFPVSDTAYEPLYDAWYWAGDNVNDQLYRDTAKVASQIGMGLYLADSGWDTATGEWLKWLNGSTGNYSPPPDKFPNLEQTFDAIRAEDKLGIDLWLQPFAVGRESTRYAATRNMHVQLPPALNPGLGWSGVTNTPFTLPLGNKLEDVNICPRMGQTERYLKNLFTDVATKYNPEGYWLDFMDGMPTYCTATHNHSFDLFGDGFRHSLQTIKDTILTYNPRAIIHFRARYANLNTKPFASVWQSGDSPDDFDRMRLNTIRLRPFSNGVVFAADETFWPDGISDSQVAKFIMTSVMTGVPAFGSTLLYSPPSTLEMMKAWLDFYRANKLDIATGKFSVFGQLQVPNHKIEGQDRTYAYIRNLDFSQLVAEGSTVFLMNATDGDQITTRVRVPAGTNRYFVQVLNKFLAPQPGQTLTRANDNNVLMFDTAVEQGGMVILTPASPAVVQNPLHNNPLIRD